MHTNKLCSSLRLRNKTLYLNNFKCADGNVYCKTETTESTEIVPEFPIHKNQQTGQYLRINGVMDFVHLIQRFRLVVSKGVNIIGVCILSPEDGIRSNSRNVVISSYLEYY
jgi:hypothetical protein